jgi:hypothetical protein
MGKLWITYAWSDNQQDDVDFIAQELQKAGVEVKLDRWNIGAGGRLWPQIENFICSDHESDAWLFVATQASLVSESCREEYAYALDRALKTRGSTFPIIAVLPSTIDQDLIPAGIRTRLYVSLRDPDWKERIVSAIQNRNPDIQRPQIEPYHLIVHPPLTDAPKNFAVIEVRPRAGSWSPFVAAVPLLEKEQVGLRLMHGAAGRIPMSISLFGNVEGTCDEWTFCSAQNEATPTMSYYLLCMERPSKLLFGVYEGTQYVVENPAG